MANITNTTTDENGILVNSVSANKTDSLGLATANTYVDKNIIVNINAKAKNDDSSEFIYTTVSTDDDILFNFNIDTDFMDTSDATATASDILEGQTAYVNGYKVTGTIPYESSLGIYSDDSISEASANMDNIIERTHILEVSGTPTDQRTVIDENTIITLQVPGGLLGSADTNRVLEGYTFSSSKGMSLEGTMPSLAATTYTPSTVDQTISADQYLSGAQIILGDTNLTAANIAKGVSIFGVIGTHEGGSSLDTSDATATADDIALGQTAYVNGTKIIGTLEYQAYYTGTDVPSDDLGEDGDIYFKTTSGGDTTGTTLGSISSTDNSISLTDTSLASDTYTLYYEDASGNKLEGWNSIGTITN